MQLYKSSLFKDGYVRIPDFFDARSIEGIRIDAKEIFKRQLIKNFSKAELDTEEGFEKALFKFFKQDLSRFINCGKQIQHLISLHQLSLNNKLIELLKGLGVEEPNISTRPVLFFNSRYLATKESFWKTPPHQDWKSIQGSINSVVVWIPLLDIDINLGAIEVIPRSHTMGLQFEETIDGFGLVSENFRKEELFVPLEVNQGDIVIFSQFLIHRSGNNSTDNIRWSCHFRYNDLNEETFIDRGYPHTYAYYPKDEIITPNFDTKKYTEKYFKNENN